MATGRIGTTPVLTTRWSKAPANGTTSLSGLDDNSVSLVYSVGYEQVYRNGVLLSRGNDYTATNGTSITLIDATITGDIIEVFANATVALTDTYTQSQANGKFINNTLTTTTGDIIYASAANTPARLGIGSTGQVLAVNGGIPTWSTPSTGALVYITGATLTNASTWNFPDNTFTSTYRNYLIVMEGRDSSNNDAIYWYFRAGGSNNGSANVKFAVDGLTFDNTTFTQSGSGNTYFLAGYPNASGGAYTLTVYAPQVATYTQVTGVASGTSNATAQGGHTSFAAFVNATTQYDAMGFTMSANSYTGTYRVYGIKDS